MPLGILLQITLQPFNAQSIVVAVIMILLLAGSAFFSAAENAFFSLSPTDTDNLSKDDTDRSKLVVELLNRPKKLLATILIGNNFVNVGIAVLSTILTQLLFDFSNAPLAGFLIQVIAVTFVILLAGEVVPKVYATQHALSLAKAFAYPLYTFEKVFSPLSTLLVKSTSLFDKKMGQNKANLSVDELSAALDLTDENSLNQSENALLKGIVNFGSIEATQIMRPRIDIKAIEYNTPYNDVVALVTDYGYSRVPVYTDTLDTVAGILHIKDLLPYLNETPDFNWQRLLHKPFFIPESKKIDDLLTDFQTQKRHIAIVADEYGGTSGLVTLEDIIEEIVGEINDEFDVDDITYSRLDDNTYIFEGKTTINDLCRITNTNPDVFDDARGESETLAGFILEQTHTMPHRNQEVLFANFTFKIESVDSRRIKRIKVILPKE